MSTRREWLDIAQAASWAGVQPGTLRGYVAGGRLAYSVFDPRLAPFQQPRGWWKDELEKQWSSRPGQGARSRGLRIQDDYIVTANGRRVAILRQGRTGRWFVCPLSRESHADPIDGMDALADTGWATPEEALAAEQRAVESL
jgi:hypothetical protein